jgi:putative oxidoreductase
MPEALYPWMHLIGRICLSLIFISSGISHLTQMNAMVGYAQSKKAPWPKVTVPLTGVMILAGGMLVMLGWHRFIGAGLLFIFLILAAYFVHAYWKETDPMARAGERAHFFKDIALAGAALLLAFYARYPWPLSLGG